MEEGVYPNGIGLRIGHRGKEVLGIETVVKRAGLYSEDTRQGSSLDFNRR